MGEDRRNRLIRKQKEAQQKRIVMLFCSVIAVVLIGSVLFRTTSTQAAPAQERYKYYTSIQIDAGDTLWQIAKEYITDDYSDMHAYINEVCSINHISENEIHAGQYIVIPYYSAEYVE